MKFNLLKLTILGFLVLAVFGCKKDDIEQQTGLIGEWNWVESTGGIGGWTLTPQSEGITKRLIITDDTFKEFVSDSLIFESTYTLESRQNHPFGVTQVFVFNNGGELGVEFSDSEIITTELCFDCFVNKYERD